MTLFAPSWAGYWKTRAVIFSIGSKARQVAAGSQAVRDAFRQGKVQLFVFAGDASSRTVASFRSLTEEAPSRSIANRERLGHWLGKDAVAVAAVLNKGLSSRLMSILDSLTAIGHYSYHDSLNDRKGGLET